MSFEDSSIRYLKGVGEKREKLFNKLGVYSIDDLLRYYPKKYIDKSSPYTVSNAPADQLCTVMATVIKEYTAKFIRKGMTVYSALVGDDKQTMKIVLFNNPYSAQKLKYGARLIFYGTVTKKLDHIEMISPTVEEPDEGMKIQPVYSQTDGLNSKAINKAVISALSLAADMIAEPLSDEIRLNNKLCHIRFALENIHNPKDGESLKLARERLIFEELLFMQLGILMLKHRSRGENSYNIKIDYSKEFWGFCLLNQRERR